MSECYMLGIDAGGTHTDAALVAGDFSGGARGESGAGIRVLAAAKVRTRHDDLPGSVRRVLDELALALDASGAGAHSLRKAERATLGATLAVNALVQGKADTVGLALSAGPGLDPRRFALGSQACVVPGGLDHRGVEVAPLHAESLAETARQWRAQGVAAVACVGKFSPRNPAHELAMAEAVRSAAPEAAVTMGHRLSGRLNFPRRIATAYYNAAVERLHNKFLDAVEQALRDAGVRAAVRLLKADGGAVPLPLSRREPVQSILSGPAASVMGVMALCPQVDRGCSLLLDMGGTTTDMALFADGSPVVDRDGMLLQGRRTLVRALASVSIGVGGDSRISVEGAGREARVRTGPRRDGAAMAFGGQTPTLLDALNALNAAEGPGSPHGGPAMGDAAASASGMALLAARHSLAPERLARAAVDHALDQVACAARGLVDNVNARPIYTLAALKALREARPERALLVGGPAAGIRGRLSAALSLPVECPPHAHVANALGAALTLPTDALEIYADTGLGRLHAPALDLTERIDRDYGLDAVRRRAEELLAGRLADAGVTGARVETTEAGVFATLDDHGMGSKDIRITCQVVPGIAGRLAG